MDAPAKNETPVPGPSPAPAPVHELKGMGEILVVVTACGHRLDRIMGEADFRNIQRRMFLAGLLTEAGEPTRDGFAAADAFLAKRDAVAAAARAADVKIPGP